MRAEQPQRTILMAHPGAELYGADRVFLESARALQREGWRVAVTLPHTGPLVEELDRCGIPVVLCPAPVLRKSLLNPRGLLTLFAESVRGAVRGLAVLKSTTPDLVYVNTLTIPLWSALARLTGRRVLTHVHEAEGAASAFMRRALAAPCLLSTSLVANSKYSAAILTEALPRLAGRTSVVYNGVPGPATLPLLRGELAGGIRLLYVGRLSPRKGVDVAVRAIALARDRGVAATLDLVGAVFPGYEWYEVELKELVRDLFIEDLVHFRGFHPSVWPFLSAADAAVVPSRLDEPFGNTAVEAILSGRPVIVTDSSGLREAAGGYTAVQFVRPDRPDDIADAIGALSAQWRHFGESARLDAETAAERHSPEAYGRSIVDAVNRTVRP